MSELRQPPVGGGFKKILYTLDTVRRIGLTKSAKALTSHNTCKACGLGMGGQAGGMTNELGEFPAVCNKSVQAQASDNRAAIPAAVFEHPLAEFQKLTGREMDRLGRLNQPLYKAAGSDHFTAIDWPEAITLASERFAASQPQRTFFYSSGRSSNEAGFLLQLLARLYGTNNVNNCSYYCHQATGVGLGTTIGTGTATVELADLPGCDLIFVIGANPASNHPRFIHQLKACRDRGGQVVVINPAKEPGLVRFALPKSPSSLIAGGSEIASHYLQPNIGSDAALLAGIGKALLELDACDHPFISAHTQGFADYRQQLENDSWEAITHATGITQPAIMEVARFYAQANNAVFAWGMGITHHRHGAENVEAIANLALLRGMVGKPSAGLLPLRGHSNVQGIGTIGVKPVLDRQVFANIEQHLGVSLPTSPGLDTLACLTAAAEGNIDAALIMGGNLFEATPDSSWAEQALDRIPFKLFLTTSLNRGHVHGVESGESLILPVTARDEEWQPTTQESMFNYVRLSDGGIERLDNTRPEVDILSELAIRLLPECPVDLTEFKSHNSIRAAIAKTIPGMAPLADIAVARKEFHVQNRLLHTPQFHTADGRARFVAHQWQAHRQADHDYPYQLMSVRSEGQYNSIIYEEKDSYRGTQHRWVVLMAPEDLTRLGINGGDRVDLCSRHGEMLALEAVPFNLPPGNLMAYYPEANVLIGREQDPRSKTPAFKSVPVAVAKSV
ncbi:FdhF/YdeP family oxidoreductase [Halioxenophilus sp. WMMB6]|uniref:FdhF/YdeP family oxidoreductase n=1 Tax=Halioxenophilus sp. WMMB6 TaxID=3073815 RepID=UPI00295E8902|nr:FdhF/YdeP family oxidoreductase [Halioxenophilus sp. WMMB6]